MIIFIGRAGVVSVNDVGRTEKVIVISKIRLRRLASASGRRDESRDLIGDVVKVAGGAVTGVRAGLHTAMLVISVSCPAELSPS